MQHAALWAFVHSGKHHKYILVMWLSKLMMSMGYKS